MEGAGEPAGKPEGEGSNDAPLTRAEVIALVGTTVGGHLKKFDFSKAVETALTSWQAKQKEPIETTADGAAPSKATGEQAPAKVDPELLKLRRDLDDVRKVAETERKTRLELEESNKQEKAVATLRDALAPRVRPEVLPTLVKAFRGDIIFDDDGTPLLPVEGGTTQISAAIEAWAKSKEAAVYLPAPTGGGSGSQRGSSQSVSLSALASKPREQWSDAERAAYFQERLRANSVSG
jgi:hypothetical protein